MDEQPDDEQAPASALIALPPDALARVCAYLETRTARRLHASAKASARALGSEAWAAIIKTNHGGLKLRPKELEGAKAHNALQKLHRRARSAAQVRPPAPRPPDRPPVSLKQQKTVQINKLC